MSIYVACVRFDNTQYEKHLQSFYSEPFNGKHRQEAQVDHYILQKQNLLMIRRLDRIVDKCDKVIKSKESTAEDKRGAIVLLNKIQKLYLISTI